jgi:hypothetical protein
MGEWVMRYRLKIEEIEQKKGKTKFKHIHNIMIDSKNIKLVIAWIDLFFYKEKEEAYLRLLLYINSRNRGFIDTIITDWEDDLIDWHSKGKDISKRDFLKNEIFFELRE